VIPVVAIVCFTVLSITLMYFYIGRTHYVDESQYGLVREKSTTVITTLAGESIRGVVTVSTEAYIELAEAAHLTTGGGQVNAKGVVRVPRTNVAYVQDVSPAEMNASAN